MCDVPVRNNFSSKKLKIHYKVNFTRNIELVLNIFSIRIKIWNDKNDNKSRNTDIISLNNRKAEELF